MSASRRISRRDFLKTTTCAGVAVIAKTLPTVGALDLATTSTWQLGCYTRPWDQHDYRVALDAIAKAGYKFCGLMTAKARNGLVISLATTPEEATLVGEEVTKRGLTALSVYAGDFPVAQSQTAGVEGLKKLIDNCAACKSSNLMVGGTANDKLYPAYYQAIAECCSYATDKGIGLSVKPHGGLNATGPQCRKAIDLVGHRNFRLWYDPGNIFYYSNGQLDPVQDAATVDGLVVGMSVKDYRHPKDVMVTPGTGRVNFPGVLTRLKEGGFRGGPLIVECLERGDLAKIAAEARKAREFLEELVGRDG